MTRRWGLVAVVVVAAAIRVTFLAAAWRTDLGFNDQFLYHHMADNLAHGRGYSIFGAPTLRWPPAFPFLLSLVYRVTGTSAHAALVTNTVLSILVVPATAWALRPRIGLRASIGAAWIVALLPGQWLFAGTILSEPVSTLQVLLVLGIAVRTRPRPASVIALGLLIGFAALTRGEGALLGLVVIAAWWPHRPRRQVVIGVAAVAAVALVMLVPWIVRNSDVAGERTGLSLNFAETVFSGHNPRADGGAVYATHEELLPAASAPFGPPRELAQADLLQRLAWDWAKAHPREEIELVPKRVLHLLDGDSNAISIWVEGGDTPVLGGWRGAAEALADVAWYALFAAFVATLLLRRRHLRGGWLAPTLVLPTVSLVLYGVVLYGNFRYRIPYEPLLALVVAAGWLGDGSSQTATQDRSGTVSSATLASS